MGTTPNTKIFITIHLTQQQVDRLDMEDIHRDLETAAMNRLGQLLS